MEKVLTKNIRNLCLLGHSGGGKTSLAKAIARSIDAGCSRIQFTPDLLPSDVTGINYFNQKQIKKKQQKLLKKKYNMKLVIYLKNILKLELKKMVKLKMEILR